MVALFSTLGREWIDDGGGSGGELIHLNFSPLPIKLQRRTHGHLTLPV